VLWVVAPCSLEEVCHRPDDGGSRYFEISLNFYQTTRRINLKTAIFTLAAVRTSNRNCIFILVFVYVIKCVELSRGLVSVTCLQSHSYTSLGRHSSVSIVTGCGLEDRGSSVGWGLTVSLLATTFRPEFLSSETKRPTQRATYRFQCGC
jgi:hypothetical protein